VSERERDVMYNWEGEKKPSSVLLGEPLVACEAVVVNNIVTCAFGLEVLSQLGVSVREAVVESCVSSVLFEFDVVLGIVGRVTGKRIGRDRRVRGNERREQEEAKKKYIYIYMKY